MASKVGTKKRWNRENEARGEKAGIRQSPVNLGYTVLERLSKYRRELISLDKFE